MSLYPCPSTSTTTDSRSDFPIVIIGAGIAGLACAIALNRKGFSCTVIEKNTPIKTDNHLNSLTDSQGYGIQLGPRAIQQLHDLGVSEQLQKNCIHPHNITISTHQHDAPLCHFALKHLQPYWLLPRHSLYEALHDRCLSLNKCHFFYNTHIKNITPQTRSSESIYKLTTQNNKTLTARLIIDASGYRSACKSLFKLSYSYETPYTALRGIINKPDLAFDSVQLWLLPDIHCIAYPITHSRQYNCVIAYKNRSFSHYHGDISTHIQHRIHQLSSQSNPSLQKFSHALNQISLTSWPLYTSSENPRLYHDHIAFVGDSVQPILPFLAQGASLALEDANTLATCLEQHQHDIKKALHLYHNQRYALRKNIATFSKRQAWINSQKGLIGALRNTSLRLFSRQIFYMYQSLLS